jgi:flagellar biosynthesis/type III secretory pathway protein FliH
MMDLPKLLEDQVGQEIDQYEQEKTMPYIDSATRRGIEQGLQQGLREGLLRGIELGLKLKFRAEAPQLMQEIRPITEVEKLEAIRQAIETAATPEELRQSFVSKDK